jgi:hypothetical protein
MAQFFQNQPPIGVNNFVRNICPNFIRNHQNTDYDDVPQKWIIDHIFTTRLETLIFDKPANTPNLIADIEAELVTICDEFLALQQADTDSDVGTMVDETLPASNTVNPNLAIVTIGGRQHCVIL